MRWHTETWRGTRHSTRPHRQRTQRASAWRHLLVSFLPGKALFAPPGAHAWTVPFGTGGRRVRILGPSGPHEHVGTLAEGKAGAGRSARAYRRRAPGVSRGDLWYRRGAQ